MLTLTENATTILQQLTTAPEGEAGAESVTVRIASVPGEEMGFSISPATAPESADQVVEQDGATVYLDADAATVLSEAVLDAGVDESGNVQFALGQQG